MFAERCVCECSWLIFILEYFLRITVFVCIQGGDGSAEGLEKSITLKNDDNRLMAVSVVPREKSCFDMPCSNFNLMPGEEKNMVVRFVPLAVGRISERVQLEVNGLSKIDLFFKGEGAEFDVDLASHTLRNINFGALRVGHSLQKTVKLVNKSIIPATFQVGPRQALDRLKECDVDLTLREGAITLQPKATCLFDVRYAPRHRRAPFNEELFVLGPGNIRRPLLMITGTCQGVDVKLESEFIAFGAIVHKSSTIRKLQILNTGDIGVRYRWDVTQFHPDFTISPAEGYISAGMDAALEIVFNPLGVKSDIRYEQLVCEIEGGRSLNLTLTGSCILAPMQNEVLKFNVPVRQSESKSVTITNKTTMNWHVRPVIEGTVWSGADIVDIEPGQSKAYEITYTPLAMTSTDGPRHEGSLFFPLPDGTGILYKLTGVAEKPAPEQSISRDIVCKTLHIESLVVTNWMKHPQRFHVTFEVQKPDPSTTIKGFDFLDVPGESSRDYKINIYAYKEGITNVKVTFKNEHNQEYLFFLLALKATSPGTFDVLEFTTPVRRLLTKAIAVENPLAVPVSFTTTVSSTDVFVPHTFTVPAK